MADYTVENKVFVKKEFSWNLEVALPPLDKFKETFAGKISFDIETLYNQIEKEYNKLNPKPKAKPKAKTTKKNEDAE